MLETISIPVEDCSMAEYESPEELERSCRLLGCGGIEVIWGGDIEMSALPDSLPSGYHLNFFPDWLDFWRGDEAALVRKFGSREAYTSFYGGPDREALLEMYRMDLDRALLLGAQYVVFHVSDVSIEEGYTYRWEHSDREVIEASVELINLLFEEKKYPFPLLVENQWWPGFTFTDPEKTACLMEGILHPHKGIMLDTGHLMNSNRELETEAEGIAYIHRMLDSHGDMCSHIRGIHLHQSLSGGYVKANTGGLPPELPGDYVTRFCESYGHILQIDQHRPWTDPAAASIINRIRPEFLTHEFSGRTREERERDTAIQKAALIKGGWGLEKLNEINRLTGRKGALQLEFVF